MAVLFKRRLQLTKSGPDPTSRKWKQESNTGDKKQDTKEDVPAIRTGLSSKVSAEHVADAYEVFSGFLVGLARVIAVVGIYLSCNWLYAIWEWTNELDDFMRDVERSWLEHKEFARAFFLLLISVLGLALSVKRIRYSVYSWLYQ